MAEEEINSKLKIILIVDSLRKPITTCGMCRVAIERYGVRDATVLRQHNALR